MHWLIYNPNTMWLTMLMMKRSVSILGLQCKYPAAYLLPLSLPRRRKAATILLISNTDLGAHTVSLADATIHLTKLPKLVGATSLYFGADYCFIRDVDDPDNVPCLVGRLYPSKAIFASACDQKGADDPVVTRLSHLIKESGLSKMVYKTDQESALRSTIEEALRRTGRSSTFETFEAAPEVSAVGESASNGKAERAVQTFEDQLRTLKSALDSRLKRRVPVNHPLMNWLVEHTANVINRYAVTADGTTPHQALHDTRSTLKVVESAEQVFFMSRRSRGPN